MAISLLIAPLGGRPWDRLFAVTDVLVQITCTTSFFFVNRDVREHVGFFNGSYINNFIILHG